MNVAEGSSSAVPARSLYNAHGTVTEQRTMGWPLSAWQEEAENLGAHFWRPPQVETVESRERIGATRTSKLTSFSTTT
jgi:hypothetical protein